MSPKRSRWFSPVLLILIVAITIGCGGSSVNGTYHDPSGQITLELKSGGKAHISVMGEQHELTYQVEGNKITLHDPADTEGDDVVVTRNGDGTLAMAMWTLSKK